MNLPTAALMAFRLALVDADAALDADGAGHHLCLGCRNRLTAPPGRFSIALALVFFAVFFIGTVGEELGWQGYAYEPLAARHGALAASLGLGVF